MAGKSYEYRTLPRTNVTCTRILQIEENSVENAKLHAHLTEYTLGRVPRFVALSYVWGDDAPYYDLIIEGKLLRIRRNLYAALKSLRKRKLLVVWVDAICINQKDVRERAYQVSIMRQIYEAADSVIIDLGVLESKHCQNVKNILDLIYWFLYNYNTGKKHPESPGTVYLKTTEILDPLDFPKYGLPCTRDPRWQSLVRLLEHPWFWRLWVIQEALVAKRGTLIFGNEEIDQQVLFFLLGGLYKFPHFSNAIDRTARLDGSPVRHAIGRCHFVCRLQSGTVAMVGTNPIDAGAIQWRRKHLMHLLPLTVAAEATDPRDYLFALLGISAEAEEEQLRPDYSESTEQVYFRYARYFVRNGNGPSLLHYCDRGNFNRTALSPPAWVPVFLGTGLPSWVPRWNVRRRGGVFPTPTDGIVQHDFSAAGNSLQRFKLNSNGQELIVQGICIDRVDRIGAIIPQPTAKELASESLHFYLVSMVLADAIQLLDKDRHYPESESLLEMLTVFAVCDQSMNRLERVPRKALMQQLSTWLQRDLNRMTGRIPIDRWGKNYLTNMTLISERLGIHSTSSQVEEKAHEEFVIAASEFTLDIKRCRTRSGYMCQVPMSTEVGDEIVLVAGRTVPCVLRRYFNGTFSFIGESYVHGTMYGEKWDEKSVQEFRLV